MANVNDPVAALLNRANEIRGFADQLPLWGLFVQTEPLLKEFVLGNVNLDPFSNGFNNAALVNGARVLCHGRQGLAPVGDQMLLLATIGEAIFPNLRNKRLPENEARELLRMSVSQILDFPEPTVATAIREKVDQLYPDQQDDNARSAAIRAGSVENAMAILVAGMNQHFRLYPNFGTELLLQTVLAIVKTGECTIEFLNKISEGCALFGYIIKPDKDLIKSIYLTFGEYLDSRDVGAMIAYWKTLIPNKCLRIKLTVEQASWHNLTCYSTIKNALSNHKHFFWANLFGLHVYYGQLNKFKVAYNIIGNNEYYGFNNDLGEVSSTRYKDLAGACILLLIKADNDKGLRKYKGMSKTINNFSYVKFLIREYMRASVNNAQAVVIDDDKKQAISDDLLPVSPGFTVNHVHVCTKKYKRGDDTDSDDE